MKSILLVPIFWGCILILSAAKTDGYITNQPDGGVGLPMANGDLRIKILPAPGTKLNYTQIMFEHPQIYGADAYLIEIAADSISFDHPMVEQTDSSTATMLSNFKFGNKYAWRYTGLHNGKQLGWNGPYNFEILNHPFQDKKIFRVKV